MKRRTFVTRLAAAGGALTLGLGCSRKINSENEENTSESIATLSGKRTITEPLREIEVLTETDVVVLGGGPAGVAAAIAAARGGS
jgi:NADPH-dependent 2,4-dienoyl-CoA reductase/sulfur reductase-like enzyme